MLMVWDSYPPLLRHGPPFLPRDGRLLALVFAFLMYWALVEAMCSAIRRASLRRLGWPRLAAVAFCWVAAGLAAFAGMEGLHGLAHVLCYPAGMCEFSPLPERLGYALAVSERSPVLGVLIVLPFIAALRPRLEPKPGVDARTPG
jgi:hypothetical protein